MKDFFEKLSNLANRKAFVFLWLAVISIISFGILIPTLGFYWDDLPYLFQYSVFGPAGFPDYVASDRPFSAWIFAATTALFGYNAFLYHLLILVLRWACASLFYLITAALWPHNKSGNVIAASIFAIYPGFMQQPISLIYNHHFSVFAMFFSSVYLMVTNLKKEKTNRFLWLVSIVLSFSMFSIENFAMLELIRPFIIWKIIAHKSGSKKETIRKMIVNWLPYLAVLLLFLVWRVLIFKFPTYQPSGVVGFMDAPVQAIGSILSRIPRDFYTVFVKAWENGFFLPTVSDFGRSATYLFYGSTVAMGVFSIIYFTLQKPSSHATKGLQNVKKSHLEMLIGSLMLFLFAGSIAWGLDLPVKVEFAWDRMTLAFIPSVALLGGLLFSLLGKVKPLQIVLLAVIFMLAASQNFQTGIAFKRDWDNLQDFLTQLSWRVPALSENTIFITSEPGLDYYSDNSLISPVNLQYREAISENTLSHYVYFTDARTDEWFEQDISGLDLKKGYRSFVFRGNTANSIAYRFDPPACLQLMDKTYANSITIPNLQDRQVKEMRFTNLGLILSEPDHPPFSSLFSTSEKGSWCYYFEKADLARQYGDFPEVVRLGDEAIAAGKAPRDPGEWLPFLEGYLWQGDFETARMIMEELLAAEGNYNASLCYTLKRIRNQKEFPHLQETNDLIRGVPCTK